MEPKPSYAARQIAAQGTFTVNSGTAVTDKKFYGIRFDKESTVESLKVNGVNNDVKGDHIQVPATAVEAGTEIYFPGDMYGSSIQITAGGQVTLLLI